MFKSLPLALLFGVEFHLGLEDEVHVELAGLGLLDQPIMLVDGVA